MKLKKYRLDIIVIAALLLLTVSLLAISALTKKQGNYARVQIDGVTVAEYSLSENKVIELGGGTNTLVIENGVAYMSYSSCPDHTCEQTGKIRYVGQSIICLPNRLSITIYGEQTEGGVDLIS